jgi:hypothetical protein
VLLMAVNPNKKHDTHEGDGEGCIASLKGNAWAHIMEKSGVGFPEFHAWITVQKCSKSNPAFQNALREMIAEHKEEDSGKIVENSTASKDSLEEAISKELRILFSKATEQDIGKMPANHKWEEWLGKRNKRLKVDAQNLTVEDLKMRRNKSPAMTQERRMQVLYALRRGDITIVDAEDANNVLNGEDV